MLQDSMDAAVNRSPTPAAWASLVLLCLVYLLNFLDRTLIYILFPLIKKELVFDDLQLALLGTTSFVIFYTILGIPFGRLADRVSRKKMIAAGLVIWSLFSGLTGVANDFWSIFFCRVMVGVGEATLGPAAMSLLSDLFPPERRGTVQSAYSAGIPLGAAAAFFLGGQLGAEWGWRAAFYTLGFPGIFFAGLVLLIPEPERGTTEVKGTQAESAAPVDWRMLLHSPVLRWHVTGYAVMAVAANSLSIWIPSLLVQAYKVPLAEVGVLIGTSMAISGGLATAFGGAVADRFKKTGKGGRLRYGALLALLCVPLWLALLYSGDLTVMKASFFLLAGLGLGWLGPAAADVHDIVGPKLRGLGVAVYFFVVNGIGYGIAPPIVGKLSDMLGGKEHPEQLGIALVVCPIALVLAAVLLGVASRRMETAGLPHPG